MGFPGVFAGPDPLLLVRDSHGSSDSMNVLSHMTITAKRDEVLATLQKNRELHRQIVVEARAGYVDRARTALAAKLESLKEGKVVALYFELRVPVDQTKVYDTAIRMLKLHQEDTIALDGQQVRNLIEDQWDWSAEFYGTNMKYSDTAAAVRRDHEDG